MKKQYNKPSIEIVEIKINQQLLILSDPKFGGGGNADPQAPEFDFDGLLDEYEHQNH